MNCVIAHNISNIAYATVTAYSGTTFEVIVNEFIGSGPYSSWTINLDGSVGVQGQTGATGLTGATGYATRIYSGTGPPDTGFGQIGDFYIDTLTGTMYGPKT